MDKKILIIDSDEFVIKVFSFALKQAGYSVCTAGDGQAASELIEQCGPALIFSELVISPPSGFELLEKYRDKNFVIVSSLSMEKDKTRAKELGAKEYIVKEGLPTRTLVKLADKYIL